MTQHAYYFRYQVCTSTTTPCLVTGPRVFCHPNIFCAPSCWNNRILNSCNSATSRVGRPFSTNNTPLSRDCSYSSKRILKSGRSHRLALLLSIADVIAFFASLEGCKSRVSEKPARPRNRSQFCSDHNSTARVFCIFRYTQNLLGIAQGVYLFAKTFRQNLSL